MSRNSKNARNLAKARDISKLHANGEKGPARTASKHDKSNAWWQKNGSYATFAKGGKKGSTRHQDSDAVAEVAV